jgi:diguanylate cyclase (GGDEF)-like protein
MKRNAVSLLKEVKGGILIVDGEPSLHRRIVHLLVDPGYRVEKTPSSELDLEELQGEAYEVVVLDLRKSRSQGLRLLKRILQAQPWTSVILLAKDASETARQKAIQRGAYFYLTQTFSENTLRLVLGNGIERARVLAENRALRDQVIFDDQTEAYNRRYMEMCLDEEIERSSRYDHPFSILFLDLDHLKEINDRYGHIYGSKVLRSVAILLQGRLRKSDKIFRFGGDEFVVALPETDSQQAGVVVQRLSGALKRHRIPVRRGVQAIITASFGLATYPCDGKSQEELIRQADRLMYRAKREARDRGLSLDIQEQAT